MVIETGEKKLICIGVHASCQSKVSPGPQAPHFESHPVLTGREEKALVIPELVDLDIYGLASGG